MKLGVVYLANAHERPESLDTFFSSYRATEAGVEHELLILSKGYGTETSSLTEKAAGIKHRLVGVPDDGFDIGSYAYAARVLAHDHLCFLNSHSGIASSGWLELLYRHARSPGVGLVGATGSWESHVSDWWRLQVATRITGKRWRKPSALAARFESYRQAAALWIHYPLFPNPHVRTNAFLISRELFLRVAHRSIRQKRDAERFESGRRGLTRSVASRGLATLVVGKSGEAFPPLRWHASQTYRTGEQENLLVRDNRTRQYAKADEETRAFLSELAWGKHEAPIP